MGFLGLIGAFVACISWGVGDFLIQKSSKIIGSWKTIFFISISACFALFPFVYKTLANLDTRSFLILSLVSLIALFASVFDFEALRSGKITIVEPIISLELPITILLGVIFLTETPNILQGIMFFGIFFGILFSITEHLEHMKRYTRIFEKGFILAGVGAVGGGLMNFMFGFSSREIDPLTTLWFISIVLSIFCLCYFIYTKKIHTIKTALTKNLKILIPMVILDNLAWIGYGFSTNMSSLAITASIAESYVVIAVLMGIFVNKEKLKTHQIIGIIITILCVTILATTVE